MTETETKYVIGTAVVPAQVNAVMSIEGAVDRHNLLVKFVETIMLKDVDYGKVPGVDKPFLLKPGAEKLAAFFGLHLWLECIDRREDWEKGFFAYTFLCKAMRGTEVVATCEGACNSMETKYRWRKVWDWKATDGEKEAATRTEKARDKNGKDHTIYIIDNTEPWSLQNTILKMAQKRAAVGCVQIATSSSEFFAHDQDVIEGEFEPVPDGNQTEPPVTPHWIDDDRNRRAFWAAISKRGLSDKDVYALMGIEHVHDWPGTAADLLKALDAKLAEKTAQSEPAKQVAA